MEDNRILIEFSDRLVEELLSRGYHARAGAKVPVNAEVLRRITGVSSVESARKWLTGGALPRPAAMQAIASWLGVRVQWLRDGEMPKYPHQQNQPMNDISVDGIDLARGLDSMGADWKKQALMLQYFLRLINEMEPEIRKANFKSYDQFKSRIRKYLTSRN